jgi:hypothetical protein
MSIHPVFSGTVPQIGLMSQANFVPVFLFLQFYSIFFMSLGKDTFLDLAWDFPDKKLATVQHIKQ